MEIPGFDIIDKIGEGGIATIWKARQASLDRIVAIKMLKPESVADSNEVQDFMREAMTTAKVKHPNIIQIYDAAEHEGAYYFVLEFVDGLTLADILHRDGKLSPRKTLRSARSVASALDYAWEKANIVHRDIKPGNIMIDSDGAVKLADLGLAKMVDPAKLSAQIEEGRIEGTPNYISPEQAMCSSALDCRSDMYSLGATIYHMATGRMPFASSAPMEALELHKTGYLPNPRDIEPSLPLGLCQLIRKLMMKDPANRCDNWKEVVAEIDKCLSGRFLIEKSPGSLDSTVEPSKSFSGRDARLKTSKKRARGVPGWIGVPLWLALFAGLAWFGVKQLDPDPRAKLMETLGPVTDLVESARAWAAQLTGK